MAKIAPLKGIVYNQGKAGDLRQLVAPPYDVVTPEEQAAYHRSHPHNVLHIDLGAPRPEDQNPNDWHIRAAFEFNRWLSEGVLVRHEEPAIYYTEMDFFDPNTGERKTRHGFVCLLRLEKFGAEAKVRPHERTFSAHKAERLHLMQHVQAHLSQIFSVFPDENLQAQAILELGKTGEPLFDFTDTQGHDHRLWPIRERGVIRALGEFMRDKTVYIADGHHRYETALNYRRLKAESGVLVGPNSPLNYALVYLCAISDPGLTILPAHRLISRTLKSNTADLEAALGRYFEIRKFSFAMAEERTARQAFIRRLKEDGVGSNTLGLYTNLSPSYYLLKKRNGVGAGTALDSWPGPVRKLDTVVLTGLVFQEVFGMTEADLDDASRILYTSKINEAIRSVNQGEAELAAILNPTPMEQVQAVAGKGLVMPRKSTYFFPKVTTGLVFCPVNPFEEIDPAC